MSDALVQSATIQLKAQAGGGFGSVPAGVVGAPSITNVSGSLVENGELTITGSNFSTSRQGQLYYDDFESGLAGNDVVGLTGNAGAYKYLDTDSFTGSKCAMFDMVENYSGGAFPRVVLPADVKEVYMHAGIKIKKIVEGNDNDGARQAKLFRIIAGYGGDHTDTPHMGCTYQGGSNTFYMAPAGPAQEVFYGAEPIYDTWQTSILHYKLSDVGVPNGSRMAKAFNDNSFTYSGFPNAHFGDLTPFGTPASDWVMPENLITYNTGATASNLGQVALPFFIRQSQHWQFFVDSLFINDTQEAILIGDNPDLTACSLDTVIAIPMTSRASESVVATMKLGKLAGQSAYLFVRNSDGQYNSTGYSLGVL